MLAMLMTMHRTSSFSDIEFENGEDALLTDEQVAAMTTEDMKTVPWIDEEGESDMP